MHPSQFDRMKEASGGTEGFGPLLVPAEDAFRALGIGRTKGFELIRDGHLIARKLGSKTLNDPHGSCVIRRPACRKRPMMKSARCCRRRKARRTS